MVLSIFGFNKFEISRDFYHFSHEILIICTKRRYKALRRTRSGALPRPGGRKNALRMTMAGNSSRAAYRACRARRSHPVVVLNLTHQAPPELNASTASALAAPNTHAAKRLRIRYT